jgi:hypothetical protein
LLPLGLNGQLTQPLRTAWVQLASKELVRPFNPVAYFEAASVQRRLQQGLPLCTWADVPVTLASVEAIQQTGAELRNTLRWLNGVVVRATPEQLQAIRALSNVQEAWWFPTYDYMEPAACSERAPLLPVVLSEADSTLLYEQTNQMGGAEFGQRNLTGRGIRVAVLDAGFPGVTDSTAFGHLEIAASYDFLEDDSLALEGHSHGTMCVSCIGGRYHGRPIGCAPDATFLLARTENGLQERRQEELDWLAALEWADRNGAHIVSSSLGYTRIRYFQEDMDGRTSLIARGANRAAEMGILVLTAAGNSGQGFWKVLCTPGDADSVLTIGGVDPESLVHSSFSSYGPSTDGRIKPNLAGFGTALVHSGKAYKRASGTSFATPLVAGFAACARQAYPEKSWFELFQLMQQSGHLYPYYDFAHGFGVPQASRLFAPENNAPEPTKPPFGLELVTEAPAPREQPDTRDSTVWIRLLEAPDTTQPFHYVYYHLVGERGNVLYYSVIRPAEQYFQLPHCHDEHNRAVRKVRVHYRGYTTELDW